jgi:hypothetical protein
MSLLMTDLATSSQEMKPDDDFFWGQNEGSESIGTLRKEKM